MPIANFCLLFQKDLLCLNTISSIIRKSTCSRKAMQSLYKHLFFFPNGLCPHLVSRTSLCKGTDKHTNSVSDFSSLLPQAAVTRMRAPGMGAVTESRGDTDGHISCTSGSRARRMPPGGCLLPKKHTANIVCCGCCSLDRIKAPAGMLAGTAVPFCCSASQHPVSALADPEGNL